MTIFLTRNERRALRRILGLLKISKRGFWLSLFLGVMGLGSAVGLSATSAWLITRASQMPPVLDLAVAATAVRMFGVFRAFFRYLQRLASHSVALRGMDSLRLGIYDTLMDGPADRVATLKRGDLISRTGADVDEVGDLVVKSLLPSCVTGIVGVGTVIGFALVWPPAALILGLSLVLSGVVGPLLSMRATRLGEIAQQDSEKELAIASHHVIESADELQVSGKLDDAIGAVNQASDRLNRARALAARPAAFAVALDKLAMGCAIVGIFLVATGPASLSFIPAVMFAVLILTPLAAFEGTAELGAAAAQLVRSAQAAVRIDDILGPEPEKDTTHSVPETSSSALSAKDLAVGWPSGPVVAEGINLELTPGKRIAIVGPSGIGKTTLLYTLAGMLPPKEGHASINGAETWQADRSELTARISLTTEDAHIFATTVYENLRVANAALEPEKAAELLEAVGLADWLKALPHGMDTQLGTGGTSISGGERRRLLLARALAAPAPLMLLDEPGEHLDAHTSAQILTRLLEGSGSGRGILIVTHRLSELDSVDQILVMNGDNVARVSDSGTHAELVARSHYYRHALGAES
ncbi:thiol reductant ABC exporter subunit CydC [Actinomycetaceae bacterium WB03_NA08]|uniref:Thiol reductant ABC exporter subunit CydC n=1 Tax=Scrofimicrobium canadense TaxID=2652290 RepID=A0A6N7W699_9ACTO|nr:thiol reductant ABC exporter subunit CydC [Scrofimicrobium canadense]MSS83668.1 thiol reductant ABC exporter subunit CydC [Scrofimicrobium canadense]